MEDYTFGEFHLGVAHIIGCFPASYEPWGDVQSSISSYDLKEAILNLSISNRRAPETVSRPAGRGLHRRNSCNQRSSWAGIRSSRFLNSNSFFSRLLYCLLFKRLPLNSLSSWCSGSGCGWSSSLGGRCGSGGCGSSRSGSLGSGGRCSRCSSGCVIIRAATSNHGHDKYRYRSSRDQPFNIPLYHFYIPPKFPFLKPSKSFTFINGLIKTSQIPERHSTD